MTLRWKVAQFFEKLWWKRYLRTKDTKTYLDWKSKYWMDFLKKADINISTEDVILDAGCGPAGVFIVCKENEVDAIDPLLDFYSADIPHFKREDYSNTNFETLPLENMEAQAKYDKIFCLNVINHVQDIFAVTQKLCDTLKENGDMYVSIDAHNYTFLKTIFQWFPGDILHPHQYDLNDYKQLFVKKGMVIDSVILYDENFIFNYYLLRIKKLK